MNYTPNYNYKKPETTDTVDIDDLNDNFDAIDNDIREVVNAAGIKVMPNDWEIGFITDHGTETNPGRTIRSRIYYPTDAIQQLFFTGVKKGAGESENRNLQFCYYDQNKTFQNRDTEFTTQYAYVRFVYGFTTTSGITVADYGFENLVNDFAITTADIRSKTTDFTGGTLLSAQPVNTFCYISSLQNITDAPDELLGHNRYAFLETMSAKRSNKLYNVQRLTITGKIYQRIYNGSTGQWNKWDSINSDEEVYKPVYVAIGASTTEGRVHHFTPQHTTVSENAYPQYVGKVLGLKTYNLAIGSTGFLCRGTENTSPQKNFMDVIYTNSDKLADASLITLQFGFGNDKTPIYGDDDTEFPVGDWDDYYPYDESGYHPYSDDAMTRITDDIRTMLNKGATVMGCLNWCIKWLSEKYPKAQLIIIYGAPSVNDSFPVTKEENTETEGYGVPKYKINVDERTETGLGAEVHTLAERLRLCLIDEFYDTNPFNYYAMHAKNADGTYAIFSTKGTPENPVWNSHPNDDGYLIYARYTAGKIISLFNKGCRNYVE